MRCRVSVNGGRSDDARGHAASDLEPRAPGPRYQRRPEYCGEDGSSRTHALRNSVMAAARPSTAAASRPGTPPAGPSRRPALGTDSRRPRPRRQDARHACVLRIRQRSTRRWRGAWRRRRAVELLEELALSASASVSRTSRRRREQPVALVAVTLLDHEHATVVDEEACDANSGLCSAAGSTSGAGSRIVPALRAHSLSPLPLNQSRAPAWAVSATRRCL